MVILKEDTPGHYNVNYTLLLCLNGAHLRFLYISLIHHKPSIYIPHSNIAQQRARSTIS